MGFLIVIIFLLLILFIICVIYRIDINTLKQIKNYETNCKDLDEIVSKYPSNIEICRTMLKEIGNENVKIEENNNYKNCLYIAISNKIIIANIEKSFTRIQTIAHECLHSIQDRRKLIFNFIYSNIYLLFFATAVILGIFKLIPNDFKMVIIFIFFVMGYLYYFLRSFLENDAMIKAKFLSKKYMEKINISDKEEINKIINEYDKLYNFGVPLTNFSLFLNTAIKTIIICIIFIIR